MTPEQLTGLAALLLELRNWLDEVDPGSLDATFIDECVWICARQRRRLVTEGAQ